MKKQLQKIRKKIEGKQITEEGKELQERQQHSINEKMNNNYENKSRKI
jgi:hypothetical protein